MTRRSRSLKAIVEDHSGSSDPEQIARALVNTAMAPVAIDGDASLDAISLLWRLVTLGAETLARVNLELREAPADAP